MPDPSSERSPASAEGPQPTSPLGAASHSTAGFPPKQTNDLLPHQQPFLAADDAQLPLFVGVDLGGTSIKIGLVDNLGRTLGWQRLPTEVPQGPEAAVRRMAETIETLIDQALSSQGLARSSVVRVGLGSPGPMDIPAGLLLEPVNLQGWNHFPIRDRLSELCQLPVSFVNDASAAAYGEFWIGSGQHDASLVMFTLGTGVGGGIVCGDTLLEGKHGFGGELGHIPVETGPNARICSCGQPGHVEAYSSATGLIARTREAFVENPQSSLCQRLDEGAELTPILVAEEATAGDPLADQLILETADYLARACVIVLHTIDPAAITIGGAMTFGRDRSPVGRRFLQRLRHQIQKQTFPQLAKDLQLRFATLGGDAGYIGAAGVARLAFRQLAYQQLAHQQQAHQQQTHQQQTHQQQTHQQQAHQQPQQP